MFANVRPLLARTSPVARFSSAGNQRSVTRRGIFDDRPEPNGTTHGAISRPKFGVQKCGFVRHLAET